MGLLKRLTNYCTGQVHVDDEHIDCVPATSVLTVCEMSPMGILPILGALPIKRLSSARHNLFNPILKPKATIIDHPFGQISCRRVDVTQVFVPLSVLNLINFFPFNTPAWWSFSWIA